jgi:hypothetical protein
MAAKCVRFVPLVVQRFRHLQGAQQRERRTDRHDTDLAQHHNGMVKRLDLGTQAVEWRVRDPEHFCGQGGVF